MTISKLTQEDRFNILRYERGRLALIRIGNDDYASTSYDAFHGKDEPSPLDRYIADSLDVEVNAVRALQNVTHSQEVKDALSARYGDWHIQSVLHGLVYDLAMDNSIEIYSFSDECLADKIKAAWAFYQNLVAPKAEPKPPIYRASGVVVNGRMTYFRVEE